MKNLNLFKYILLNISIILLVSSCGPEENPDLVDPPLKAPTIGIRYLNLAGDGGKRTLQLNNEIHSKDLPWGVISELSNPNADSVIVKILKGDSQEFLLTRPIKFMTRNMDYTFISLPSPRGREDFKNTDTLVYFSTSMVMPTNKNDAMLRIFHAVNDSTSSYYVRFGCPNGKTIINAQKFSNVAFNAANIRSGEIPVSIIKRIGSKDSVLGVLRLQLEPQGQYTIMILPDGEENESIYILDERGKLSDAMLEGEFIYEKLANIRVINAGTASYKVETGTNDIILNNISSNYISDYTKISACESQTSDLLIFENQSIGQIDTLSASFEVMEDYSVVILDSADKKGNKISLIQPLHLSTPLVNNCVVRVVNGVWDYNSITISLAGRNTADGNIQKGETLCTSIEFGEISAPSIIPAGRIPITLFSSAQPAELIYTAIDKLEAGKDYLIIPFTDENNKYHITIIENKQEAEEFNFSEEGVMAQIVSALADESNIIMSITDNAQNIISDAIIPPSGSFATILPVGDITLSVGDFGINFTTLQNKRVLIILSGTEGNLEYTQLITKPMIAEKANYLRRFVNASIDVPNMLVKETADTDEGKAEVIAEAERLGVSSISDVVLEIKKSYRFLDGESGEDIFVSGDLSFSFKKGYTIVFAGKESTKSNKTGYRTIVIQEF